MELKPLRGYKQNESKPYLDNEGTLMPQLLRQQRTCTKEDIKSKSHLHYLPKYIFDEVFLNKTYVV